MPFSENFSHLDTTETIDRSSQPIDLKKRQATLATLKKNETDSVAQNELAELDITLEEAFTHPEFIEQQTLKESSEKTASKAISIENRFTELQQSERSVASILATLKAEFADTIDEETSTVLDKYSALLSPSIFSEKDELEAVEALFYTQAPDFSGESFTTLVHTIYEEPDTIVSEESKQKIEKAFGIPRNPIVTGSDLAGATTLVDDNGEFVHHSEDSALRFRSGVKTYMNPNKKAVLVVEGASRPHPMVITPEIFADSEAIAQLSNYALIQQMMYEEMGQLTNLFGGGQEDEVATPDSSVVVRANRFAALLIGKGEPNEILSESKLQDLRSSLKALRDPAHIGENHSLSAMNELGMLDHEDFLWEQVGKIGTVLRKNDYYRTFEMEKEGNAHRLLLEETKQSLLYGKETKTKMSKNISSGHFFLYRLENWLSRLFFLDSTMA